MNGYDVLWVPGMDHAGIATQIKVENFLKTKKIFKKNLKRKEFIKIIYKWCKNNIKNIHEQWKQLGLALNYDYERFTLDKNFSYAVKKVFVTLYNEKLIYKNKYIVNWDVKIKTAISDIEVIFKEKECNFYYIIYSLVKNPKQNIIIATTRPETIFGDVAIAVNPNDIRYTSFIGKYVFVPILNKKIPIIADENIDINFKTGAVKITPAHDLNDFKIGIKNRLEFINIMNADGTMNEKTGKYNGINRFIARENVILELKKIFKLYKIEKSKHKIGYSERSGSIIEPRLSIQWFLKMKPLVKNIIKKQKEKNIIKFYPKYFNKIFIYWLSNVHDWVISRQLWWGHRIPVWYNKKDNKNIYVNIFPPKDIENWIQEEDVLDTWFSSSLWPFVALGWPNKINKFSNYDLYFPSNTLVSGYDIIFFWISRMVFQSFKFTNKVPFYNVLIHGLIRDKNGIKMSKSLNNGIDPKYIIEKYGIDSLRWFFSIGTTPGQDIKFDVIKIISAWKFINKIWNAGNFVLNNIKNIKKINIFDNKQNINFINNWILTKLNFLIIDIKENFKNFNFSEAGKKIYKFIWFDFCDWYIEISKKNFINDNINKNVLLYIFKKILCLIHPIIPFSTEKIWLKLFNKKDFLLILQKYPVFDKKRFINKKYIFYIENFFKKIVIFIRNIRSKFNISFLKKINLYIKILNKKKYNKYINFFNNIEYYLKKLCNCNKILYINKLKEYEDLYYFIDLNNEIRIYIYMLNILKKEKIIYNLEYEKKIFIDKYLKIKIKLNNEIFLEKAKLKIINLEKKKFKELKNKINIIKKKIKILNNIKK